MNLGAPLRAMAEQRYHDELKRLCAEDAVPRPIGWAMSAPAVRRFILGDPRLGIRAKYLGDDALVDRCIVTLMSQRGLMLVGEPGTAKSMLSELLAAAISLDSGCTIQGSAGSSEDQIKYGWNYALLLAQGPTPQALVKGPMYRAMEAGKICRFEELTRVQPEVSDCLISLMSDKLMQVPELSGDASLLHAKPGFNVIATANIRDRGVHEMSSALKRRFNFETVKPVADAKLEAQLIREQTRALLQSAGVSAEVDGDVVELLVDAFHELRSGVSKEGQRLEKPGAVLSSAEAVAVMYAATMDALFLDQQQVHSGHLMRQMIGTVLKDNAEDGKKLRHWLDVVVKPRAMLDARWQPMLAARAELDR